MIASIVYLRSFWWFALAIPLFGVVAFAFGFGILKAIGAMAICWPLTIPGRALMATGKASTLFGKGCTCWGDGEYVYFEGDEGMGIRISYDAFRSVSGTKAYDVITTRRLGFVAIPISAWSSEDREKFLTFLRGWTQKKLE